MVAPGVEPGIVPFQQYFIGTASHRYTQGMMALLHTRYDGLNVRGRNGLAYAQ